jgi:hypothetical protein
MSLRFVSMTSDQIWAVFWRKYGLPATRHAVPTFIDNPGTKPADVEGYLRARMTEPVRRELERRGIDRPPAWR